MADTTMSPKKPREKGHRDTPMKLFARSILIAAPLAFLVAGTVAGQRRYQPAGRGAFLGFQVDSTEELIAVLRDNPTLRQRYARHFGVSESEIIDFIRRALVPY